MYIYIYIYIYICMYIYTHCNDDAGVYAILARARMPRLGATIDIDR